MNAIFETFCAGVLAILGVLLIANGMEQVESSRPEILESYRGTSSFEPADTISNPALRRKLSEGLKSLNHRGQNHE